MRTLFDTATDVRESNITAFTSTPMQSLAERRKALDSLSKSTPIPSHQNVVAVALSGSNAAILHYDDGKTVELRDAGELLTMYARASGDIEKAAKPSQELLLSATMLCAGLRDYNLRCRPS